LCWQTDDLLNATYKRTKGCTAKAKPPETKPTKTESAEPTWHSTKTKSSQPSESKSSKATGHKLSRGFRPVG
jgi:hypothetical protein